MRVRNSILKLKVQFEIRFNLELCRLVRQLHFEFDSPVFKTYTELSPWTVYQSMMHSLVCISTVARMTVLKIPFEHIFRKEHIPYTPLLGLDTSLLFGTPVDTQFSLHIP